MSFERLLARGYSVFGFPQSLFYKNATRGRFESEKIKESISKGLQVNLDTESGRELAMSKVIFSWREKESYTQALELYPFVNNVVLPDMGFQLGPFNGTNGIQDEQKVDVVLFLRKDGESVLGGYRNDLSYIAKLLQKASRNGRELTFKIVDWHDRLKLFDTKRDFVFSHDAIQLVSMGKVIVADRLHATILAYLSGVPVVYIDQLTGKISKALDVAFGVWDGCRDAKAGKWAQASNFSHALELAAGFV